MEPITFWSSSWYTVHSTTTVNRGGLGSKFNYVRIGARTSTLEEAKFKLKKALGVSDEFYQHCQAFPIHGMGQGSTNSPTIWLIISSTLFDIHDELGNGANFCGLLQFITMHSCMVGFVDGATGQTNNFRNNHAVP
eukprot:8897697-Ditylum_brightwellii.AAC.1